MFTGLIQDVGRLEWVEKHQGGASLKISTTLSTSDWELGESVAVQGACLTVTKLEGSLFSVDCSPETMRRTTLGRLRVGAWLHLERALQLSDRLGGHLVSGHIDGVGIIRSMKNEGNSRIIDVETSSELMRYMIEKGSICVDGVSLTLNTLSDSLFSLAIIPHTVEKTGLNRYKVGDEVNLEVDMVAKYIERFVQPWKKDKSSSSSNIDDSFLKKHGFM